MPGKRKTEEDIAAALKAECAALRNQLAAIERQLTDLKQWIAGEVKRLGLDPDKFRDTDDRDFSLIDGGKE